LRKDDAFSNAASQQLVRERRPLRTRADDQDVDGLGRMVVYVFCPCGRSIKQLTRGPLLEDDGERCAALETRGVTP
jgi:hypothetical protein